jgi:hypothetical protein
MDPHVEAIAAVMERPRDAFLTVTELRSRGWTPAMTRDLLGKEDLQRRNPFYRAAAPVRLWALERVLAAESTGEFTERQTSAARRRSAARTAGQVRASKLRDWAATVPISVDSVSEDTVVSAAIAWYNDSSDRFEPAGPWCDEAFLARITVNFLRHMATPYDREMSVCRGKPGVRQAQSTLRGRVLAAISEAHPGLAAECERQRHR